MLNSDKPEDMIVDIVNILPPPQQNSASSVKYCRVDRDYRYDHVRVNDVLLMNLQLDSDIYIYNDDGQLASTPTISHRHKFITNKCFQTSTDVDAHLRLKGKIPSFLEIRESPGKGWGVFTLKPIQASTFLGHYEGILRPGIFNTENRYVSDVIGFNRQPSGVIDGENILFSNWTRFINDGKTPNVTFSPVPYQLLVHTSVDLPADAELLVDYGENYWTTFKQVVRQP